MQSYMVSPQISLAYSLKSSLVMGKSYEYIDLLYSGCDWTLTGLELTFCQCCTGEGPCPHQWWASSLLGMGVTSVGSRATSSIFCWDESTIFYYFAARNDKLAMWCTVSWIWTYLIRVVILDLNLCNYACDDVIVVAPSWAYCVWISVSRVGWIEHPFMVTRRTTGVSLFYVLYGPKVAEVYKQGFSSAGSAT